MEKSTKLGHRKGSRIADNLKCVGVGALVGGLQFWLVCSVCVVVLCGGGGALLKVETKNARMLGLLVEHCTCLSVLCLINMRKNNNKPFKVN